MLIIVLMSCIGHEVAAHEYAAQDAIQLLVLMQLVIIFALVLSGPMSVSRGPLPLTHIWHDTCMGTILDTIGKSNVETSLLVQGCRLSSWCSGFGTEDIILSRYIVPAAARHGISVQLEVASSCEGRLVVVAFVPNDA